MAEKQEKRPTISVSLLTYNHENYIRQCLDGIVMQVCDFEIEVIVGDDCSTDATREILDEYKKRYPNIFKLVLRKKNLGVTRNLYDVLRRCRGKYIAGLEGDDYWTDKYKLQKQVDFLERHSEYIGCGHEVRMVDEYDNEWYFGHKFLEGRHWTFNKKVYSFKDFENFNLPGQGSTWVYRNIYYKSNRDFSIIAKASPAVGDMTILLLTTVVGDWYFMQGETMTCYRYITSLGKENWASWIRTRNRCDVDFMFRLRLEDYSKKVLRRKLDLSNQKFEMVHSAFEWYRWGRNKDDLIILFKILTKARPLFYYLLRELRVDLKRRFFLPTVAYAIKTGEIKTDDARLRNGNWRKFERETKGRTIIAFGSGLGLEEFCGKYGKKFNIPCVLDNFASKQGKEFVHYRTFEDYYRDHYDYAIIIDPNEIKEWDRDKFTVIITSSLYQDEMAAQLRKMGFYNYYSLGIMEEKRLLYRLFRKELRERGDK